jgi:OOP family OmpA-OmpF porin
MMIADNWGDIGRRLKKIGKAEPPPLPRSRIYFESKANTLTPAANAIIEEMAEHIIRVKPDAVRCVGHTDSVGDPVDNHILGTQRAAIVKSWLHIRGVPASLIVLASEGSRQPRVPETPGIGETENRRVEVILE